MSEAPFFSVIIPCYNVEESVLPTLRSVEAQGFRDFEVIAVNDGSTDTTGEVLASYAAGFPFRVVTQENRGLGGARNSGIAAAEGRFLAFLDADDLWAPNKLARVFDCLQETGADLVCHDEWFEQDGRVIAEHRYGPHARYHDLLFKGNCLSPSAVAVRRQAVLDVGGFTEDRRSHGVEDYDLWMRLADAGAKIHFLHETLGTYVLHGSNMSEMGDFQEREGVVLERHFAALDMNDAMIRRLVRRRRALYHACVGWGRFRKGRIGEAVRFYLRALTENPFERKLWRYVILGPGFVAWQTLRRKFLAT
jgi:teichuronic acid biosynthesis glycosyltransferase TuaG